MSPEFRSVVLARFVRPRYPPPPSRSEHEAMTKQKTHKGVVKRMKLTKSGKVKRRKAFTSHIMVRRSRKRKRHLRAAALCVGKIASNMAKCLRQG